MWEGVRVYQPEAPVIPYNEWKNRKLSLYELLNWTTGQSPDDKELNFFDSIGLSQDDIIENLRNEVVQWIKNGELKAKGVNNGGSEEYPEIDPFSFFELAAMKGWCLPSPIHEFLHQNETKAKAATVMQAEEPKPWLIADPRDPEPAQHWYTPARYFARQLVIADSTLLTKPDILAGKIVQSLTKVGIMKRGGKLPFDAVTIKKALSNVSLG